MTIDEKYNDITKNRLQVYQVCDECNGTGDDYEDSSKNCFECKGTGKSKIINPELLDFIHEALKKQREICAEIYRTNPDECWGCINESILNAPEPEI